MTGIHRDTLLRLGVEVGSKCAQLLDQKLTNLNIEEAEINEVWCYVGKTQERGRSKGKAGIRHNRAQFKHARTVGLEHFAAIRNRKF